MAVPFTKRARRALRSRLVRLALWLAGLLPVGAALAFGRAVGRAGYRLAGGTRRLALASLAVAFPEKPEAEREALARAAFLHLGQSALELAVVKKLDPGLERYVEIPPADLALLEAVMARGKGMVFVTGHVGNWELLARRIARAGVPNAVIAKKGGDAGLNDLAARFRAQGGVQTLWREDASTGRAIISTLRGGRALGLLIDQDTKVQGVFVPFFGRPAFTPRAAADLALRFGAPVVVGTCRRRPEGGHVLSLVEVPCDPSPADREAEVVRLTAACTLRLEEAIRAAPAEWVWMHQRWKTQPEPEVSEGSEANSMPKTVEFSGR